MNKMTLDEEMKLWETRANDEFGQILKKIHKATKDYLHGKKWVLNIIHFLNTLLVMH